MDTQFNGPLHEMAETTKTDYWNDSCSVEELNYAIERGASGATSNPTIVYEVLKKEMPLWKERILQIIAENPTCSEEFVTWQLIEEISVKGAGLLMPVFEKNGGMKGRLSMQTNPIYYRDTSAIVQQAVYFHRLAPNIQVKIPVTQAGVKAIEEATYHGVNINATVCFSVSQAVAVAEAVENGLIRREKDGLRTDNLSPVCTIMIGRLDDWMQALVKRDGVLTDPGCVHWAGIAALKKAYAVFQERGYRTRLLGAAYRSLLHWTELIGGDIVLTIPYPWQKQFNGSMVPVVERMHQPVPEDMLNALLSSFPDFRRAYEVDGMSISEFDTFGPTVRTLRGFIGSYHDLIGVMREFMLPNPEKIVIA
jgi:transaldolase